MPRTKSRVLSILALVILLGSNVQAQEKRKGFLSGFKDSQDGAYDISDWLLQKKGFLLMPTIITEPAVDYGLAGALVWFHESMAEKKSPPSMTGILGAGTLNGTWGAGLFHIGYWKEDRIRFKGALIKGDLNVNYYGSGNIPIFADRSILMKLKTWFVTAEMTFRLGASDFFAGARWDYMPTDITFETPVEMPEFSGQALSQTLSEASAVVFYDTRNNVFTPTTGFYLDLSGSYSDTWFGGQAEYGRVRFEGLGYFEATPRINVGLRYESAFTMGDVPFWARPWVDLRGAPQVKYQNKNTATMEAQVDWSVYKRWTLLGFTGIGHAFEKFGEFDKGKTVRTIGAGFRYLIARKLGADMGMDFAFSNDDWAFYIVFGSAWAR
jgi:hypothetical protein